MILKRERKPLAEVPMSPLIDCVFLLLIFFLVTSMLKKSEKQVPVALPDPTVQVADRPEDDLLTLGIDREGAVSLSSRGDGDKMLRFEPMGDLTPYLTALREERGTAVSIQFAVEAGTETQVVVTVLDTCQLLGFDRVFVRLQSDDYLLTPDRDACRPTAAEGGA